MLLAPFRHRQDDVFERAAVVGELVLDRDGLRVVDGAFHEAVDLELAQFFREHLRADADDVTLQLAEPALVVEAQRADDRNFPFAAEQVQRVVNGPQVAFAGSR